MRRVSNGQGLVEYSLAAGALVLLTVGGLTLVATNFTNLFEGVGNRLTAQGTPVASAPNAQQITNTANAVANEPPLAGGQVIPNETFNSIERPTLYLSNGAQLNLQDYPLDGVNIIETSGSSGYMQHLSYSIEALGKELKEQGAITEAQANGLYELANQGLKMSRVKAEVDRLIKAHPEWSTPEGVSGTWTSPITFEGETYVHFIEFAQSMGVPNQDASFSTFSIDSMDANNLDRVNSKTFVTKYNELQQQGVLNDPTVAALVSDLSSRLLSNGDVLDNFIGTTLANYQGRFGEVDTQQNFDQSDTFIVEKLANNSKHQATSICSVASGTVDAGTCQ